METGSTIFDMQPDQLFGIASQLAAIGWLVLIFAPRKWQIFVWLPKYIIPVSLSILYSVVMLLHFFGADGGFASIESVRSLFQNDYVLLAGWTHYMAFDLFIGAWIGARCDELGISRLIQPVFFAATFMFGPLGLLLFLLTRAFYKQKEVVS